jgi:DMSO/TMAO reductase YedYZ molybdopterin-dependent catalytic subunit
LAGSDKKIVGVDKKLVIKDAQKIIADPYRRLFLKKSMSLGALVMLTGCDFTDGNSVDTVLKAISRFNDKVQGWLFDPTRLAPEYTEAQITRPFPFNAYYGEAEVRPAPPNYKLKLSGLIANKRAVTLPELHSMPQTEQITRHICVEGWSAVGRWGGVKFSDFLTRVGADMTAKFVGFRCFDDYYTSIDMPTALHPQTLLTLTFDGKTLPPKYGYPMKLRMPTKLGYKNPKYIAEIFVTNDYPGGYWEDQGYEWFAGS